MSAPMGKVDIAFWDLPGILAASKNRDWRDAILATAEAMATVFTEKHLVSADWLAQFRANPCEFRPLMSELTPEGLIFAGESFEKWLQKTDRWKTPATVEKLTNSLLEQLRAWRQRQRAPGS